jgi:hypothetical protein
LLRTILQLDGSQFGYRLRTSLGSESGISHALGVEQDCLSLMNGGKLPTKAQLNPDLVGSLTCAPVSGPTPSPLRSSPSSSQSTQDGVGPLRGGRVIFL